MSNKDPHFSEIKLFMAVFYQILDKYDTHEKAYEALELRHVDRYGVRKYANYESFRRAKSYHSVRGNY